MRDKPWSGRARNDGDGGPLHRALYPRAVTVPGSPDLKLSGLTAVGTTFIGVDPAGRLHGPTPQAPLPSPAQPRTLHHWDALDSRQTDEQRRALVETARAKLAPPPSPRYVVRKDELARALAMVDRGQLPLVVSGVHGSGVSALLRTMAADEGLRGRVLWVNLAEESFTSPGEVADHLAKGLDYLEVLYADRAGKIATLAALLAADPHDWYIALDGATPADRDIVDGLAGATPSLLVGMKTSRDISTAYRKLALGPITETQALALVADNAPDMPPEEARQLCREAHWHVASIVARLQARDHQAHPDGDGTRLVAALGLFAGRTASAKALAAVAGVKVGHCRRTLARLLDGGIVVEDGRIPDNKRYTVAETAEPFLEVDPAAPEQNRSSVRYLDYYVRYARRHREHFDRLEAERENLLHTWHTAKQQDSHEIVSDLWFSLDLWLDVSGQNAIALRLMNDAQDANQRLNAAGQDRTSQLGGLHVARAEQLWLQQDPAAIDEARTGLAYAKQSGVPSREVAALTALALCIAEDRTAEAFRSAHALLRKGWRLRDQVSTSEAAYLAYQLGQSHWDLGSTHTAARWFRRCRRIAAEDSSPEARRTVAYALTSLGRMAAQEAGRLSGPPAKRARRKARALLDASRAIKEDLGETRSLAIVYVDIAELELSRGVKGHREAITLLERAAQLYGRQYREPARDVYWTLGRAYESAGEPERALSAYAESCRRSSDDRMTAGSIQHDIARLHAAHGRLDEAKAAFATAVELRGAAASCSYLELGRVECDLARRGDAGGCGRARTAYRRALDLVDADDDQLFVAIVLAELAEVDGDEGDLDGAVRHLQRAREIGEVGAIPRADQARTLVSLGRALLARNAQKPGPSTAVDHAVTRCLREIEATRPARAAAELELANAYLRAQPSPDAWLLHSVADAQAQLALLADDEAASAALHGWEQALGLLAGTDPDLTARVLEGLAGLNLVMGRPAAARSAYAEAVAESRRAGRSAGEQARLAAGMAVACRDLGDDAAALDAASDAVRLLGPSAGPGLVAMHVLIATTHLAAGQALHAVGPLSLAAQELVNGAGELTEHAAVLHLLAFAYLATDRPGPAAEVVEYSGTVLQRIDDGALAAEPPGTPEDPEGRQVYADMAALLGDPDAVVVPTPADLQLMAVRRALRADRRAEARFRLDQALAAYRLVGDHRGEADTCLALGDTDRADGDYASAGRRYAQAVLLSVRLDDEQGEAASRAALGLMLSITARSGDDAAPAVRHLSRARELYTHLGRPGEVRRMDQRIAAILGPSSNQQPSRPGV